jgi:hypothetical protein
MEAVPARRTRAEAEEDARQRLAMLQRHLEILHRLHAPQKAIKSVEEAIEERRKELDR